MGLDREEDKKRLTIELSMRAARKRQSSQTGFVHHCYEVEDSTDNRHDTIPLYENFCFVLALLRSKTSDNMLEALNLLQKLLHFEQDGSFPVYLHEFPLCRDRLLGIKLLPVFHAILFNFHTILESALRSNLECLMKEIIALGMSFKSLGSLPLRYEWYITAFAEPLCQIPDSSSCFSIKTIDQMADFLIAAQIAHCKGSVSNIENIAKHWHSGLGIYKGPQEMEKGQPKPTLFDLFMSDLSDDFPSRLKEDHPMHLRACIVYPMQKIELGNDPIPFQSASSHPRQPYTLYWGSSHKLHSLACDPKGMACRTELKEVGAEILFISTHAVSQEGPVEAAFYCNIHLDQDLLINGCKATVFQLDDVVEIHSDAMRMKIIFSIIEGEGIFYGHLSRANRPLQTAAKGALRYEVYDWEIGLRTIRRSDHCIIKASIAWEVLNAT